MTELFKLSGSELIDAFASSEGAPSAGSAAALAGALAAALTGMVARLTVEKGIAGSERLRSRYGSFSGRARELAAEADRLRAELQSLAQQDAELVDALLILRRTGPAAGEAVAPTSGSETLDRRAVEVPLHIGRASLQVAEYAEELCRRGYQSAAGDVRVAVQLALAAARSAVILATANLKATPGGEDWIHVLDREREVLAARLGELQAREPAE